MSVSVLKRQKNTAVKKKGAVVNINNKVKDYSTDPFFVKKAKAAEAFLKKHGLPPTLTR
jgi:hypothetical protein